MQKSRFGTWRRLQLALMLMLFLGLGCNSGSSGCSCAKPIQGGFPKADILQNVAQVKLTKRGKSNNQGPQQYKLPETRKRVYTLSGGKV